MKSLFPSGVVTGGVCGAPAVGEDRDMADSAGKSREPFSSPSKDPSPFPLLRRSRMLNVESIWESTWKKKV